MVIWINLIVCVSFFVCVYLAANWYAENKTKRCIAALTVGITLFLSIFYIAIKNDEKNKGACEKIGGHYIVVGHEQSGKTRVAIYGCVKE